MAGSQALQQLLEGDQSFRAGEHTKQHNAAAARATASSGLGNFLKFASGVAAEYFTGGLTGQQQVASAFNHNPAQLDNNAITGSPRGSFQLGTATPQLSSSPLGSFQLPAPDPTFGLSLQNRTSSGSRGSSTAFSFAR